MGVQERRAREKENIREEILDAARTLFVKEGYENVSIRKIAAKIEYAPGTIYLYFEDKLPQIDFSEVRDSLDQFITQAKPDGCAALFLLQHSTKFGGHWCLEIIRSELIQYSN